MNWTGKWLKIFYCVNLHKPQETAVEWLNALKRERMCEVLCSSLTMLRWLLFWITIVLHLFSIRSRYTFVLSLSQANYTYSALSHSKHPGSVCHKAMIGFLDCWHVLAESNVMNDSGRMTKCVKINMVEIFLWNMNQFSG